jgi:mannosyltransferase OCH1-like enzyme
MFLVFFYVLNNFASVPKGFGINFDAAMTNFVWYRPVWTIEDPAWAQAKRLYNMYVVHDVDYKSQPRIPKIVHHIWLGSPLPELYKKFRQTWMDHHPDWQFMLWTEKEIEEFGLNNKDQYDASINYGQKSDIARYEILYRLGGLYVDTDFVCLRPFDVFHHTLDFYTGLAYSKTFATYNGLIGSEPGNLILKECIETLNIYEEHNCSAEHNILLTTGPFRLAYSYAKCAKYSGRAVAFPINYFYPWPQGEKYNDSNLEQWYRNETFAIHYWHTSWRESKKSSEVLWQTVMDFMRKKLAGLFK